MRFKQTKKYDTQERAVRLTGRCLYSIAIDIKEGLSTASPPFTPLPPAFSITAPQLDSVSHLIPVRRRRERALQKDETVKAALKAVSDNSFAAATSMSDVDTAQKTRREQDKTLRGFFASAREKHDKHHVELRTARAHQVLASEERKFLRDFGRAHRKLTVVSK